MNAQIEPFAEKRAGVPADGLWSVLRSPGFAAEAHQIIAATCPEHLQLRAVAHLRSAHYAVFRVEALDGSSWIVRIGATADTDGDPAENKAFLGTSATSPTGQYREFGIARGFAAAGAAVIAPHSFAAVDGFDVLWVPFVAGTRAPVTAAWWHEALTSLHAWRPAAELPVFTNRAKSFARLDELPEAAAGGLRNRYDTALEALFEAATAWSAVHGGAHAGNVINTGETAVLFDFDTVCWAPSAWDISHLLNRAGTTGNTGYTAAELAALFPFTDAEIAAALELRKVAAVIAREHRNHAALVPAPVPSRVAA
jgi:hypothetical protein